MAEICKLREANGFIDQHCDGERCVFWRAVEQIGHEAGAGCAVQHFELLGDDAMAKWLLSVKERVVQVVPSKENE